MERSIHINRTYVGGGDQLGTDPKVTEDSPYGFGGQRSAVGGPAQRLAISGQRFDLKLPLPGGRGSGRVCGDEALIIVD